MKQVDLTIITGMSGAGRSSAGDVLEDLGFFVIDNLPPELIPKVAELARTGGPSQFAFIVDSRSGVFIHDLDAALAELRTMGAHIRIVFLDASDQVLVRRFEASRRLHPLGDANRVSDGIARERELLEALKGQADLIVDTSNYNVHELRDRLRELFSGGEPATGELQTSIVSFGYKHGVPVDVDLLFDCRFLPNPHWVDRLRPLPGTGCERPRLRVGAAGRRGVPRGARAALRALAPSVHARGQGLSRDWDRLHRRTPSQRRHGGRAREDPRRPRFHGHRAQSGHRP